MSKKQKPGPFGWAVFTFISVAPLSMVIYGLMTGDLYGIGNRLGVEGGWIRHEENPRRFWIGVVFYSVLGGVFTWVLVRRLVCGPPPHDKS